MNSCTVRGFIQNFSLTPKRTCRVLQFYNDLTSSVDQANKRFNIKRFAPFVQQEGDIGVCGIAVLVNFSCGISVILILNCVIAVFSESAG